MIKIPRRLKASLNDEWCANVSRVIINVEKLYLTTPYFFPEYTNHGIIHINNVLSIIDKLIPDISLKNMQSKEIGISIIALVLHDIGMFLSYNGFVRLLEDKNAFINLESDLHVQESWEEYLSEIKYLSEKQLKERFGTSEINYKGLIDENNLDNKTRLIIGDFLRQQHHNIAHYIIMVGTEGIDFLEGTNIDVETRDIIGLIARSHGMDVRDTEQYLKKKYNIISKPKNISVFYTMVLIRLADYLDAGEERAPHIIKNFYVRNSELSKKEFEWNQAIKQEDFVWDSGRECISIDAAPMNAMQFIDLNKWIKGVQYELDLSWAILGEHYDVNLYKISIRRLESNILKREVVEEYEKNFHTKEALLDANADILKLLISPLYGDNPSYGIRELLQNAVDACREREKKEEKSGDYKGQVNIYLDKNNKTITISDNGIGMTIDIIKKYYLIAGASYRRSDAWSKKFAESDGQVRILRNGKFGVGVLATFLLGEKATVITRNIEDKKGWTFSIDLEQENIEIKRVDAQIGTKVVIELTDKTIKQLDEPARWDCCKWNEWYVDANPCVTYYVDGIKLYQVKEEKKIHGYELKQNEYNKYFWSYNRSFIGNNKSISCNGIVIPQSTHFNNYYSYNYGVYATNKYRFNIRMPYVRIEDWNGKIPIDLARSKLVRIPCETELFRECCKYFLAKFLTLDIKQYYGMMRFECTQDWGNEGKNIIFTSEGYTLCDAAFIKMADIQYINFIGIENYNDKKELLDSGVRLPTIFNQITKSRITKSLFEEFITENFLAMDIVERFIYIQLNMKSYEYVQEKIKRPKWKNLIINKDKEKVIISKDVINEENLIKLDTKKYPVSTVMQVRAQELCEDDIMLEVLKKYLGTQKVIPYELEERKKVFSLAFDELKIYMQ